MQAISTEFDLKLQEQELLYSVESLHRWVYAVMLSSITEQRQCSFFDLQDSSYAA